MYPFKDDNVYLKNCWYVAAAAEELDDGPIERTIMDYPVALFRMEDGTAAAMHGVCPHRYFPLARGKVVGNAIQCGYHGFCFDGHSGACVHVPSQPAPTSFRQRTYPLVEHGKWLWIWPGEQGKADPALLPPLEKAGLSPEWKVDLGRCLHSEGRAQLLVENLLDLTHVDYLHTATLQSGEVLKSPVTVREEEDGIFAGRISRTPWVDGFYDLIYGAENRFEGDHESLGETWYWSPGYLRTGLVITGIDGQPRIDRSVFGNFYFHHFLTPETPHSCHYFSGMSRNYRLDDREFSEIMLASDLEVRQEDIGGANGIEIQLARPWTLRKELLVRADAPAIQARRKIQAQLDSEAEVLRIAE